MKKKNSEHFQQQLKVICNYNLKILHTMNPVLRLGACLYGSRAGPLSETARARSRCVVIFIVKTIVRLYGQAGWPGFRDLA